jgi:hypothetical protein
VHTISRAVGFGRPSFSRFWGARGSPDGTWRVYAQPIDKAQRSTPQDHSRAVVLSQALL